MHAAFFFKYISAAMYIDTPYDNILLKILE